MRRFVWILCFISCFMSHLFAEDQESTYQAKKIEERKIFPIGVWLQSPDNAKKYLDAGINYYIGLWDGPTEEQLSALKKAGMKVICDQNAIGLKHKDDPTIAGWMHQDEPDNAQPVKDPKTGEQTYGPPVNPDLIVKNYQVLKKKDPSRPILLNLGQGVANDEWVGRGPDAHLDDYKTYVKGCDIVSFDVYPITDIRKSDGENYLWYVAKGVQRLREWSGPEKTIWNVIECTHINNPDKKATPHQVKAMVWMSIIHGSTGIVYFVHEFKPAFNEHALLNDLEMLSAVTKINQQVQSLAPVIFSPSEDALIQVQSSDPAIPIACMVKQVKNELYIFAVNMRNKPVQAAFSLQKDLPIQEIQETEKSRVIPIKDKKFNDVFESYDVRIYKANLQDTSGTLVAPAGR